MNVKKLAYFQTLYDNMEAPSNEYEEHFSGVCDACGDEFDFSKHDSNYCVGCDKKIQKQNKTLIKKLVSESFDMIAF